MLFHYLYTSRCVYPQGDVSNLDILREARARNRTLAVTGYLLRDKSRFLQVVEGPEPAVTALIAAIARDGRHFDFRLLGQGPLDRRFFPGWCMGYTDLDCLRHKDFPDDRHAAFALLLETAGRALQRDSAPSIRALTSSISPSPSTVFRSPLA